MSRRTNRRDFLRQSALAGIGFWAAGGVTLAQSKSANEKLNIACIGVGGKGSSDTDQAAHYGNIVALCDIDDNILNGKGQAFPQAKRYNDFRKMLEEMGKQIDAVTVSTPDHTHAPASIMAMNMGKHVYCQKPLTHSVHEARQMRLVAEQRKVCTQMGNQGTALGGLRTAVEIVRAGVVGPVKEVHVWTNRPIWPQAPKVTARPPETPAPKHVHWDLWLGPAPHRPYAVYAAELVGPKGRREAYHPFNWRGWWDFGTGALGDMGCHTANMAFLALELRYPTLVAGECGDLNPETCPSWATTRLEFPRRGDGPHQQAIQFFWYEGQKDGKKNLPPADLLHGENPPGSGSLIVGAKGVLYSPSDYGHTFKLLPSKSFEGFKPLEPKLPRYVDDKKFDDNMKQEWVRAIKENKPDLAFSNFNYAGLLTEAILLGNVAMRAGKTLEWDGENLRATNCPEAAPHIKREYRKGWNL